MVPLSFICLLGTIGFMFVPQNLSRVLSAMTLGFGIAMVIIFFIRVAFQIRQAKPELYFKPQI
jgi:cyanate permease